MKVSTARGSSIQNAIHSAMILKLFNLEFCVQMQMEKLFIMLAEFTKIKVYEKVTIVRGLNHFGLT